ncbi:hypothetical protein ACI6QG_18860 [Roseococcus sp. DSY-14]|uniref:hypothetical protein n=1 Tax=Roseococcus sp. DSY-14 TaxID=3369650 RepID=UPI00387B8E31
MEWNVESAREAGVSSCGWRRKAKNKEAAITRWEGEKFQEFSDLCHLARQWDFQWGDDGTVAPAGLGAASRLAACAEGRNFAPLLHEVLADIARVAVRKGCRMPRDPGDPHATWPLKGGVLRVYCLRPAALDILGGPSSFMRLCFLLVDAGQRQGEGKHFYQWGLWNKDKTLLPVDKPIASWRITDMKQVDHKVFIVKDRDGRQAVLKFEVTPKPERYECTNFLAENLFEDGMMSVVATAEDVAALCSAQVKSPPEVYTPADPTEPKALNPAYPEFIRLLDPNTTPRSAILCKNEFKAVRKNLRDQLRDANQGTDAEKRQNKTEIFRRLYTDSNFIFLGKIAVFDILVNNNDRIFLGANYAPDANLKNWDFSMGYQPITIDNFDPNGHATPNNWRNHGAIRTAARTKAFAKALLADLVTKTGAEDYLDARTTAMLEGAFIRGIAVGKRNIVELLNPHGRTLRENWGATGAEYFRRAEMLREG